MFSTQPKPTTPPRLVTLEMQATAAGFRQLADAAERGEIIGAAYTVIDLRGATREGAIGAARRNTALAHQGASRLASLLLWDEIQA